jgi:trimethylamine--corrinoid protein Co-methyltransferase
MFRNQMPRYEILSADAVDVLDQGWRRIVSEVGIQFAKPEAVELFKQAGQRVTDDA